MSEEIRSSGFVKSGLSLTAAEGLDDDEIHVSGEDFAGQDQCVLGLQKAVQEQSIPQINPAPIISSRTGKR